MPKDLSVVIQEYIDYMKKKHNIIAAMVAGSYVTGKMGPNSDIDIFFVWTKKYQAMRGREWFLDVEFEYFISPEWKYYHRMKDDLTTMSIYASAQTVYDPNGILQRVIGAAKELVADYSIVLSTEERKNYLFWLETVRRDGNDLYEMGYLTDFLCFTGSCLQQLSNLICKLNNYMPVYHKYGSSELKRVDNRYALILEQFLLTPYEDKLKKDLWKKLCCYVEMQVGAIDISNYQSSSKL